MSDIVTTNNEVLSLTDMSGIMDFGKQLAAYITKNNLSTKIQGNNYAHVDGWKYAGANFGLSAIPDDPVKISDDSQMIRIAYAEFEKTGRNGKYLVEKVVFCGFYEDHRIEDVQRKYKIKREEVRTYFAYKCNCEIIRLSDGATISKGTGVCSNMEAAKATFDEYAINSMAQTRSIGKGYRNIIGYVMNNAGYETTPAEEMSTVKHEEDQEKKAQATPEKQRMKMNDKQMKKTITLAHQGKITMEKIEEHFVLTEDQKNSLLTVFELAKSK